MLRRFPAKSRGYMLIYQCKTLLEVDKNPKCKDEWLFKYNAHIHKQYCSHRGAHCTDYPFIEQVMREIIDIKLEYALV